MGQFQIVWPVHYIESIFSYFDTFNEYMIDKRVEDSQTNKIPLISTAVKAFAVEICSSGES